MKISAVIITFNEERNIDRCLRSLVTVADEILVVDSFSTDQTERICLSHGARFIQNKFPGHIEQKNFAMEHAANDWVLSLDADEALTEDLQRSILSVKPDLGKHGGYKLKRLTSFCGKWVRHTGWYPDKKIRLWNREEGRWGGQNPHDKVIMNPGVSIGQLEGDLLHYSFYELKDHIDTIQKFSSIAAQSAYENGKRANLLTNVLLGPLYTFVKKYFFQLGFLDGYTGFIISMNSAFSKFLKYTKLREIQRRNG